MFKNLNEVFPEVKFYLLINQLTQEEHHVTMSQLIQTFGEDKVLRMQNNLDTHWLIVDIN